MKQRRTSKERIGGVYLLRVIHIKWAETPTQGIKISYYFGGKAFIYVDNRSTGIRVRTQVRIGSISQASYLDDTAFL